MNFPSRLNFPSKNIISKSHEFREVFKKGKTYTTKNFIVHFNNNSLGYPRLGVVVGKKVFASAVRRNRLKRLIREVFRKNKLRFDSLDVVIVASKMDAEALDYDRTRKEICDRINLNPSLRIMP
jgi:ribonuclease P protein component